MKRYYFRDLWRILECKSLWITHIFAIYTDLSVVSILMIISAMRNRQLWWFLVWFICRVTKFFANSSDFHNDYICFFCQYSCPIWLSFLNINLRLTVGLTFHPYFPHTLWRIAHHKLSNINSKHQLFLLLSREKKFHQITSLSDSSLSKYFPVWLTSATFNELKNYNSSSLMPSLLFVFEVKVDYFEGNFRMVIYKN